jgi:hypothetical protein
MYVVYMFRNVKLVFKFRLSIVEILNLIFHVQEHYQYFFFTSDTLLMTLAVLRQRTLEWYINMSSIQFLNQVYKLSAIQTFCSYEIHEFHTCACHMVYISNSFAEYLLAVLQREKTKNFPITTYFIVSCFLTLVSYGNYQHFINRIFTLPHRVQQGYWTTFLDWLPTAALTLNKITTCPSLPSIPVNSSMRFFDNWKLAINFTRSALNYTVLSTRLLTEKSSLHLVAEKTSDCISFNTLSSCNCLWRTSI